MCSLLERVVEEVYTNSCYCLLIIIIIICLVLHQQLLACVCCMTERAWYTFFSPYVHCRPGR